MSAADYSYFDALLDAVFVFDEDRKILYCNEAAAKMVESSVRRMTRGKSVYDFIEFCDRELFFQPAGLKGRDEALPMQELSYRILPSGREGKAQISLQPFQGEAGKKLWIAVSRDTTLEETLHAKHHEQLRQLEAYSKNLEKMVEDRTLELQKVNVMLSATMNSLGQGFLVFDRDGLCSNFYTKACEEILECQPAGKKIADVLKINSSERANFEMWMSALFGEQLPFNSMKSLGPSDFVHSKNLHVRLDYYPLRNEAQAIERVVLVATDWTNEFLAQEALEKEKKFAKMIVKLVSERKQFSAFLAGIPGILENCHELVRQSKTSVDFDVEKSFRLLHTLEGEAAIYSAGKIWEQCRAAEEIIEPVKKRLIEFDASCREKYIQALNELVAVYKSFLVQHEELFRLTRVLGESVIEMNRADVLRLCDFLVQNKVAPEIVEHVKNQLLAEEIIQSFRHYGDVALSVAEKLGKQIHPIDFVGGAIKVMPGTFETLFSTFVHVTRNMVDHGIEAPEEREMMGKEARGRITFEFSTETTDKMDWLIISVRDDGQGIDHERLRNKIVEARPEVDLTKLSQHELIQAVFDPGLTTKQEVGEFSGRGVGLNAVKDAALALGGSAEVFSELGKGTRVVVRVPLKFVQKSLTQAA